MKGTWGNMLALVLSAGAPLAMTLSAMAASATATGIQTRGSEARGSAAKGHSLLQSRELWATVDVCNPANEPNTVGVRGSMPGDGHEKDAMYMRFQLQYLEAKGDVWTTPVHGADSGFVAVGAAKAARQGGSSFRLGAAKGTGYTLRGLVTFQWRRAGKVVHQATRMTSAGHRSVAGADPAGYSAAECAIG
jgi:hypothetical protein